MITRISGTVATFVVSCSLFLLLEAGVGVFADLLSEYPPPKFAELIFLFTPASLLIVVDPLLLAAWYWFLSKQDPPPRTALIWHILALVFSAILVIAALLMLGRMTYMDSNAFYSPGRWVVSSLITAGLAFAVWRSWKQSRAKTKVME